MQVSPAHRQTLFPVAAQTARRVGLPHGVQLSLRHYSEWWNGKGVPGGVGGEEITLTARVVHVASVAAKFDVLGGPELAVEAVRRQAGTIFDPAIAAVFVANAGDLLQAASGGDPRSAASKRRRPFRHGNTSLPSDIGAPPRTSHRST